MLGRPCPLPNPGHGHPHMKETIDLISIEYLLKSFLQIARGQMKFAFIWKVQRINYTADSAARINWGQTGSKLKLFWFFFIESLELFWLLNWKSGTFWSTFAPNTIFKQKMLTFGIFRFWRKSILWTLAIDNQRAGSVRSLHGAT